MKQILYLFLFVLTNTVLAQTNFDKANILYRKAKYEAALKEYNMLLDNNQQSAELYFNIANCYFKLHQVAPSIYYYEKALILNPDDKDITNNLKFAQKKTIDEIKVLPKIGFILILRNFTQHFHYNTWAWITVGFGLLFLAAFFGYYFSVLTLNKRIFFSIMALFLFCLLIALGAAFFEKQQDINDQPAIVFAEKIQVHTEPKKNSTAILVLHEGAKVYILEKQKNWNKVQLTDGTEGWIDPIEIKEIK